MINIFFILYSDQLPLCSILFKECFTQRNLGILIPTVLGSCSNETLEHFAVYCLLFQEPKKFGYFNTECLKMLHLNILLYIVYYFRIQFVYLLVIVFVLTKR